MKRSLFLVVLVMLSAVLVYPGCKKKTGQTPKPPSDVNAQTQTQEQSVQQEEVVEPPPPPPGDVNISVESSAPDVTIKKPVVKKVTHSPGKTRKPGVTARPGTMQPDAVQTPEELKQFDALAGPDEKMDFISEFADAHPESTAQLALKALDDNDPDVRQAAMEAMVEQEASGPEALDAVRKALTDQSEDVRQSAVEACANLDDPQTGDILSEAINDENEDVRTAAVQAADGKETPVRLDVLKAGLSSKYVDVKEACVSSLIDLSTPGAVDALLVGLKDRNPEFRETVSDALDFLVGQEFKTYEDAVKWWKANHNRFDEELNEKD